MTRAGSSAASNRQTIREALGRDSVHPFPARMAPGIALQAMSSAGRTLRVLDPMAGSGTVLAVARAHGHRAIGFDLDPLAALNARVWTTAISYANVSACAEQVLLRARRMATTEKMDASYPVDSDDETKLFIDYWFDPSARKQLAALSRCIAKIVDNTIREALWCAFSRLIIAKQAGASLALDLAHSRPHRAFETAPVLPFDSFEQSVARVTANCLSRRERGRGLPVTVRCGDARKLPLRSASIDLVITSPPYLNAIDYLRCSKFSLVWMGYSTEALRSIRRDSIGTEVGATSADDDVLAIVDRLRLRPTPPARQYRILVRFVADMLAAVREVARVLAPGGRAIYVVGENTLRGTYVRNALAVQAAGELAGLEVNERRARTLPSNRRYMPPPAATGQAGMNARMRQEVVLTFSRPS